MKTDTSTQVKGERSSKLLGVAENQIKLLAVAESQSSIADWAEQTFGPPKNAMAAAISANTEMSLLLRIVANDLAVPLAECSQQHRMAVADAAAGVMIQLYRLAEIGSFDLLAAVDNKMRINRKRESKPAGGGAGRHVREDGGRA